MDNRINPQNGSFLLQLYDEYLKDSNSVDQQWQSFFSTLPGNILHDGESERGASWATSKTEIIGAHGDDAKTVSDETHINTDNLDARQSILDSLRAIAMIRAYRIRGHLKAKLDPLDLSEKEPHPELEPSNYGFSSQDWDRPIFIDNALGFEKASLRQA